MRVFLCDLDLKAGKGAEVTNDRRKPSTRSPRVSSNTANTSKALGPLASCAPLRAPVPRVLAGSDFVDRTSPFQSSRDRYGSPALPLVARASQSLGHSLPATAFGGRWSRHRDGNESQYWGSLLVPGDAGNVSDDCGCVRQRRLQVTHAGLVDPVRVSPDHHGLVTE